MNLQCVSRFLVCTRQMAAVLGLAFTASVCSANINLEFRPASQNVNFNCDIRVGLYAVSDSGNVQVFSAVQAIITWDISKIQLIGIDNTGTPPWLASGFLANPYHLNDSLTDGDAMWIGLSPLGAANAIPATTSGTLLTTFRFQPLASTPATAINIAARGGNPVGSTIVYDGSIPNSIATGLLIPASAQVTSCTADTDFNHFVNVDDLLTVINHWGPCPMSQLCCPGDVTGNGFINVDDLLLVINQWGACP